MGGDDRVRGGEQACLEAEVVLRRLAGFDVCEDNPHGRRTPGPPAEDGQAATRLRQMESRFHTLVEQIPAVTFMAALDGGINELYVSPQIEALLGFSQREWLENPVLWYTQLHPDDRARWHEEFARTCVSGAHFRSEYRFLARDGRVVWVRGECQVVRDAAGRPQFLQGIAYDITEAKKAEEALRGMHAVLADLVRERTSELLEANHTLQAEVRERRRLEEALRQRAEQLAEEGRQKDHFLAILAHELRNPLAPIRNAIQILRQPGAGGAAEGWAREMIDRQVRHLGRLIDDLLDVSRIRQGKVELRKERVDLAGVICNACESTRPLLNERRHRLTVTFPSGPLELHADPARLEQVLVNLLTNAAKYTDPEGRIALEVGREGDEVVLRVRDNGVGIPPEMLERIFDLFAQVDASLDRSSQWGLGIGLTLVRRLVELHGGSVRAFSAGPGQGSEFVVRLPVAEAPAPRAAPAGAIPGPAAPGTHHRVLVVDDNADLADSLALLIRWWGHEVSVVYDGPAALAAARAQHPDVVLLDVGMPRMSGYQVARQLRQQWEPDRMRLVALTGYGRPEDRRRSREAGFDCHLTKPVDPEVLKRLLAAPATFADSAGTEKA